MLQVARLAPKSLGEATDLVVHFLRSQFNPDGGVNDRAGNSDLYYTVFGLEGLLALRADVPSASVANYLRSFGDGESLDFVHLSCLARCWAGLPKEFRPDVPTDAILNYVERYRTPDGAYDATPGAKSGSLYGCFLALGAYEDLGRDIPDPAALVRCAESLRTPDGGYANDLGMPLGLTPSTAAAATLLRHLDSPVPPDVVPWLLSRHHPEGGFFATPDAAIPDLLSTATALHALAGLHADLEPVKEPCLDFLDTLWTNKGAFYGTWEDDTADSEYTYYALLALGHLSL
jgi:prenyltransferase beta subunit